MPSGNVSPTKEQQEAFDQLRREMVQEINSQAAVRAELEKQHGQVWDTDQMRADFEVTGFMAPFVGVVRRSDGKKGTLMFQHMPRFYFGFESA